MTEGGCRRLLEPPSTTLRELTSRRFYAEKIKRRESQKEAARTETWRPLTKRRGFPSRNASCSASTALQCVDSGTDKDDLLEVGEGLEHVEVAPDELL